MNTRPMDPILLVGAILLFAAALTWVVPAGRYQRRHDPNTGQNLVVPGSYRSAPRQPVGAWGMLLAVPEGLAQAAAVVFYCFLAGGALTVIEKTGAIGNTLDHLVSRFGHRRELILLLITTLFLVGGACYGMYEEIIAFLPLLCGLMARIGLDGETALALSVGSACVAGSFSPFNTFTLGISQPMAELPLFSGFGFRTAFFVAAVSIWIVYVLRHARRSWAGSAELGRTVRGLGAHWRRKDIAVLGIMNAGMGLLVAGAIAHGWELAQFSAVFLVIAFAAGLTGGLGLRGVSEAMAEGFRRMAYASLLIGFARAISVVLANGVILDTIADALFNPLRHASLHAAGVLMLLSESALSLPMPSDSGKAMMSLPIMIPLADLLGLSRQMVVSAFQYSGVVSGLAVPTAGSLLAMLAVAGVPFRRWLRFVTVPVVLLTVLAALAIAIGVALEVR